MCHYRERYAIYEFHNRILLFWHLISQVFALGNVRFVTFVF